MKVVVGKTSLRLLLNCAQGVFFAAAVVMLGYCTFVLADTWIFQARESAALARFVPIETALPAVSDGRSDVRSDVIGRMEVPRLGVSVIVMEGTSSKTLRRAVGHIAGTGLPGQPGNVGIAGHRDTFFRPLRNIQREDIVTLTTPHGEYRYRVVSTRIVAPDNVAVLNPDENEFLTLVTCYPFYFVGSAPERFIVRAARIT